MQIADQLKPSLTR